MAEITSIQIKKETKKILDSLKTSVQESYSDIIENLIEDSLELSEQTIHEIEQSLSEISKGEFLSLEEVKKKFKLT